MRKILLATVASAAVLSSSAFAADLPARAPAIAPAPVFMAMNWSGFYLGGQVGAAFGSDRARLDALGVGIDQQNYRNTALIGGLHAGYNAQFGSLVVGIEADGNISGWKKSATSIGAVVFGPPDTVRGQANYEFGLVGKVGVAFDNALLYVLGGGTLANFDVRYNLANTLGVLQKNDDTRFGWTVGAGAAYKFNPNWSARVEYRYSNFGSETHALGATPFNVRHRYESHRVMAGISYHFGGSAAPIVAKY